MNEELQLAQVLSTYHHNLILLDDLRQTNKSLAYLTGVASGVIGTLFVWGIWRIL